MSSVISLCLFGVTLTLCRAASCSRARLRLSSTSSSSSSSSKLCGPRQVRRTPLISLYILIAGGSGCSTITIIRRISAAISKTKAVVTWGA